MVWDKSILFFARIGESAVVDSVPLAEVKRVDKVDKAPASSGSFHHSRNSAGSFLHARTPSLAGGHSASGRTLPSEETAAAAMAVTGPRTRIVEVRVLAAQNLPIMDAIGTCDPFCRLVFCGETRETTVIPAPFR